MADETPTEFNVEQSAAHDAATATNPQGQTTGGSNSVLSANGLEARFAVLEAALKNLEKNPPSQAEITAVSGDIEQLMSAGEAVALSPTILTIIGQLSAVSKAVADLKSWLQTSAGVNL